MHASSLCDLITMRATLFGQSGNAAPMHMHDQNLNMQSEAE